MKRVLIVVFIMNIILLTACDKKQAVVITAFNGVNEEFAEFEKKDYKVYYVEEDEIVEFTKQFITDWFNYRNITKDTEGKFLHPEFKSINADTSNFSYNSSEFKEKYAWSKDDSSSNTYMENLIQSESPKEISSEMSVFNAVKIIRNDEDEYVVGVDAIFKGLDTNKELRESPLYCTITVIKETVMIETTSERKEQTFYKVKDVDVLYPLSRTIDKQASEAEINEFKNMLTGYGEGVYKTTTLEYLDLYRAKENGIITEDYFNSILTNANKGYSDIFKVLEQESLYQKIVTEKKKNIDIDLNKTDNMQIKLSSNSNIEDIRNNITINRDIWFCTYDKDYKSDSIYSMQTKDNDVLLGRAQEKDIEIFSGYKYLKYNRNYNVPEITFPMGYLTSENTSMLVVSKGYAVVPYTYILDGIQNEEFTNSKGLVTKILGIVTFNEKLNIAFVAIDNKEIEPVKLSDTYENLILVNQKDINIVDNAVVGESRIEIFAPNKRLGSVVFNENSEVLCIVVSDSASTLYSCRGIGSAVVSQYIEKLNSISTEIGYKWIEKEAR